MPFVLNYLCQSRPADVQRAIYEPIFQAIDALNLDFKHILDEHVLKGIKDKNKVDTSSFWVDIGEKISKGAPELTTSKHIAFQRKLDDFAKGVLARFRFIHLSITRNQHLKDYEESDLLKKVQILSLPETQQQKIAEELEGSMDDVAFLTLKACAANFGTWQTNNLCTIWEAVYFLNGFQKRVEHKKLLLSQAYDVFHPFSNKFASKYFTYGVPLEDLQQTAIMELNTALEGYDTSQGPFKPHARMRMKQGLDRLTTKDGNSSSDIELPNYLTQLYRKVERELRKGKNKNVNLWNKTPEELASLLVEVDTNKKATNGEDPPSKDDIAKSFNTYVNQIESIKHWLDTVGEGKVSMDGFTDKGADPNHDKQTADPSDHAEREDDIAFAKNFVDRNLPSLNKQEQLIIRHRFGIDGYEFKTLEEIGSMLKVSRERVRQLELRAIKKLNKVAESPQKRTIKHYFNQPWY